MIKRIVIAAMVAFGSLGAAGVASAEPVVTFGDPAYDCRTMSGFCSDSGSQGNPGNHFAPGYYSPTGIWRAPL